MPLKMGTRVGSDGSEASAVGAPGVSATTPPSFQRPSTPCTPSSRTADSARFKRRQLVGLESGVAQVVVALVDAVAVDRSVLGLDRLDGERDAHLAQVVLVALERPPEGDEIVGVARHPLANLLGGERTRGLEQRGGQVQEPLELVHRRRLPTRKWALRIGQSDAMSFSTRSSRDLNGSLHSTVRWAWSLSFRCTQSTV